ncbi:hypothetical protein [Burkholderia sp. BCC1998]|nr:hypothetical protein [Burkholderia sp. BCC1998]
MKIEVKEPMVNSVADQDELLASEILELHDEDGAFEERLNFVSGGYC